jgi:DUF1680 family protein
VTVVRARGRRRTDAWGPLHRPLAEADAAARWAPVNLLGIPYFAWANRGPTPMAVWLARS